jgi:hypothetical protein
LFWIFRVFGFPHLQQFLHKPFRFPNAPFFGLNFCRDFDLFQLRQLQQCPHMSRRELLLAHGIL